MSKFKQKALEQALSESENLICLDIPKLKKALRKQHDADEEIFEHVSEPSENSILHNLILLALPSPSQRVH